MPHFEEIDAERINVVGRDGRPRLVIANEERMPPPVLGGRELKRQGRAEPGMIFYNHQGDECGGLVYGGGADGQGYAAGAGLLFDQFGNDQVVGITYDDTNGRRSYGLRVWERPGGPLDDEILGRFEQIGRLPPGPGRDTAWKALVAEKGPLGAQRLFCGRSQAGDAVVDLCDGSGRPRLRLKVSEDGAAGIEFLGADGQAVYRLAPEMAAGG